MRLLLALSQVLKIETGIIFW